MTISYPLAMPDTEFAAVTLRMRDVVAVSDSPTDLNQQLYDWGADLWVAELDLVPMFSGDYERWTAWLAAMRGRLGTTLLGDPLRTSPRGVATGTPLVKGAGQTGRTLVTDGWTGSVTGILKAGDMIQLGSGSTARLHQVLADADSNFSGEATLDIWPRLRSSPADNAPLTLAAPKGLFRLADNERSFDYMPGRMARMRFTLVEALS